MFGTNNTYVCEMRLQLFVGSLIAAVELNQVKHQISSIFFCLCAARFYTYYAITYLQWDRLSNTSDTMKFCEKTLAAITVLCSGIYTFNIGHRPKLQRYFSVAANVNRCGNEVHPVRAKYDKEKRKIFEGPLSE